MSQLLKESILSKLDTLFNEVIVVRTDDAELKKQKVIASDLSIENWDWSQGWGFTVSGVSIRLPASRATLTI